MENESVKKSLEKSKNVLEEKRKTGQAKNLHKKDQHAYNNCYELRSGAINKIVIFIWVKKRFILFYLRSAWKQRLESDARNTLQDSIPTDLLTAETKTNC